MTQRRALITTLAVLSAILMASSLIGPAEASTRGHIGIISPDNPVLEKSYPPIPGRYPPNCAGPRCTVPFQSVRQQACNDRGSGSTYCDTIEWRVDMPDFYPEIHSVIISLSWGDPKANDMDLYVWQDDVDTCEPDCETDDLNCCLGPAYGASTTRDKHPETVQIGEPQPDDPETEETDEGQYWVTVLNYSGINAGYKLKFEWTILDLGPGFTRQERTFRGGGAGGGSAGSGSGRPGSGFGSGSGTDDPRPTELELIKVPGDDGTLTEQELGTLLAAEEERQTRTNPLIPVTIAVLGLGFALAAFFFLWKRKRRLDEEALLP